MQGLNVGAEEANHLLRQIWRRKTVVGVTSVICFVLIAVVILSLKPRYSSEALILLASKPSMNLGGTNDQSIAATDPFEVRSEVDILASDELCLSVIDDLDLAHNREFAPDQQSSGLVSRMFGWLTPTHSRGGQLTPEQIARGAILDAYKTRLGVFNDGRSLTVHVSFSARDPLLASEVANAHANAFLIKQARRRLDSEKIAINWLRGELEARGAELTAAENEAQRFLAAHGMVLTEHDSQQQSAIDLELIQVNEHLTAARLDADKSTALLDQIGNFTAHGVSAATTDVLSSPVMTQLRQKEADANLRVIRLQAEASVKEGVDPALTAARADLGNIRQAMVEELSRVQAALQSDVNAQTTRVNLLHAELAAVQARKTAFDKSAIDLRSLNDAATGKRVIYQALLNRFNLLLAQNKFEAADATIASTASIPIRPSFPKTSVFLLLGLCVSLCIGAAVAIAIERWFSGAKSMTAMTRDWAFPAIGVPLIPAGRSPSAFAENLLSERVGYLQAFLSRDSQNDSLVIAVSSCHTSEGKPALSALLAGKFSSSGAPTLLINADWTDPDQSKYVGDEVNLVSIVNGSTSLAGATLRKDRFDYDVLMSGLGDAGGDDIFSSQRAEALLAELRTRYKIIIVAARPILASSDFFFLARLANRKVLVVDPASFAEEPFRLAVKQLESLGIAVDVIAHTGQDEAAGRSDIRKVGVRTSEPKTRRAPSSQPLAASPRSAFQWREWLGRSVSR